MILVGVAVIVALISVPLEQMSTSAGLKLSPITSPVMLPYLRRSTLTSYFVPAANGSTRPSLRSTSFLISSSPGVAARYVCLNSTVARPRSKPSAFVSRIVWSVVSVPLVGTSKEEIRWGLVNGNDAPESIEYSTSPPVGPLTVKFTEPSSNSDSP